jgi:hypothetical protein
MVQELEVEFRVYLTREPGGKRECVATRSVPHALQVWNESVDAYSRSLELVISGDWLMQLLMQNEREESGEVTEVERAKIAELCLEALAAGDVQSKQTCLEQVLATLGYDLDEVEPGDE